MVLELRATCMTRREAITVVLDRIGCSRQTLFNWVRAVERRQERISRAPPAPSEQSRRLQVLEGEVRELRQVNAALMRIVEAAGLVLPANIG